MPETAPPPMLDAAVTFGRVLRRMGLPAGPDRVVEFVRAVEELDVTRREDVYWAGRITMCSNPDHLELYDRAFRLFWDGEEPPRIVSPPKSRLSLSAAEDSVQPPKKTVEKSEKGEEAVRLRYSPVDILRKKDFADCTPEEFAELHRLMADLHLSGDLRRSRRLGPAPRGRRDARRTLRDACAPAASLCATATARRETSPGVSSSCRRLRVDGLLQPGAPAVHARERRLGRARRSLRPGNQAYPRDPRTR